MEELKDTETTEIEYKKSLSVVQANELIRSKQDDFSLLEIKILRLAVSQIVKNETDFKTYTCRIGDLAKYLNISEANIYRDIKDTCTRLLKKTIYIEDKSKPKNKGKPNYKIFHWIDYVEYNDGKITFRLSESLSPYLLGLERLFTLYNYEEIINLPTSNAVRLYELIESLQNMEFHYINPVSYANIPVDKNEFIFEIDWLRKYFNCESKYPNNADFVKRIIDGATIAIRKNTFMNLTYRTHKDGRNIKYIIFRRDNDISKERIEQLEKDKPKDER